MDRLVTIIRAASVVDWGSVPSWLTALGVGVATKQLHINACQRRDDELKPARLVTVVGALREQDYRGDSPPAVLRRDQHVELVVTNDAEGPILDVRPLIQLVTENDRYMVSYGLCWTEDNAEHRIRSNESKQFDLHLLQDSAYSSCARLVFGLEFTDLTGVRWRRLAGAQPFRLVGKEAAPQPLITDDGHEEREWKRCCGYGRPNPESAAAETTPTS